MQWAVIYEGGDKPPSEEEQEAYRVLETIYDTYYLVNVVDNNYASEDSDMFAPFRQVILDAMTRDQLMQRMTELETANRTAVRQVENLRALQVRAPCTPSAAARGACQRIVRLSPLPAQSQGAEELRQAHTEIAQLRSQVASLRAEMREQQAEGLLKVRPL